MITSINLFNKLREEILTGKLRRGYRLIEAELYKKYKISRTPVRDSLIRLEMCGLVENLPNRGAFVTGLDPQEIEDIFKLRRLYEDADRAIAVSSFLIAALPLTRMISSTGMAPWILW